MNDATILPVVGFDYDCDGDRHHAVACLDCGEPAMVVKGMTMPHRRESGAWCWKMECVNIAVTCEVCGGVEVVPYNDPAWDPTLRVWSPAHTPACTGCQHDEEWLDWWRFNHEP